MKSDNKKLKISIGILYTLGTSILLSIIFMTVSYFLGLEYIIKFINSMNIFYKVRTIVLCLCLFSSAYFISRKMITGIVLLPAYLALALIPRIISSITTKQISYIHPINIVSYTIVSLIFIYLIYLCKNRKFK